MGTTLALAFYFRIASRSTNALPPLPFLLLLFIYLCILCFYCITVPVVEVFDQGSL